MIFYSNTKASEFLRWRGSVAPKCLVWALPCSMLTIVCQFAMQHSEQMVLLLADPSVSETTGWTLFTGILGFLLVFRAQLSYNRYWERLTLFERGCGAWLNASSNLIAFCSAAVDKQQEVDDFQYLLSRYMSLLVSCSMSDISGLGLENFPTLSLDCVDPSTLRYLGKTSAQQNVLLQWVQRLVVDSARAGVIDIPTPILTCAFQELSIGIVHMIDARKLARAPFPFPYAQMAWVMLAFFTTIPVPLICASSMPAMKAAVYTFLIVFVFWAVHYIAVEIEMPFGRRPNDLPLGDVNRRFNRVLERLLETTAQQTLNLERRPAYSVRYNKQPSTCDNLNVVYISEPVTSECGQDACGLSVASPEPGSHPAGVEVPMRLRRSSKNSTRSHPCVFARMRPIASEANTEFLSEAAMGTSRHRLQA